MQDPRTAQGTSRTAPVGDAMQQLLATRVRGVVRSVDRRAWLYDDPGTFHAAIEEVLRGLAAAGLLMPWGR